MRIIAITTLKYKSTLQPIIFILECFIIILSYFQVNLQKVLFMENQKWLQFVFLNYDDKNIYINDWYNLFRIKDVNNKIYSKDSFALLHYSWSIWVYLV